MTSYQSKTRLFLPAPGFHKDALVPLDERGVHYLRNVLRMEAGASVTVFNGHDGSWMARIKEIGKKKGVLELEEQVSGQEDVPDLWLLFAPVKRDRIDYLVEKATELGVAAMQPVLTKRTQVERVKMDRLRAHSIEALEQCGRTHVPTIEEPVKLEALLQNWDPARHILYCDEMLAGEGGQVVDLPTGPWAILIGPEGGFDAQERDMLHAHPATYSISLGPRILRADTAALAAITYWQTKLGDW